MNFRRIASGLLTSMMVGGCSFLQSLENSPEKQPARVEDVIAQIKTDLRGVDLTPVNSKAKACGGSTNAHLELSIVGVQVSLQNTEIIDTTLDASGKNIPVFGIPISPGLSTEAKRSNGTQIDISFEPVSPAVGDADPKATVNPELGSLVRGVALGIVNANHAKPCLKVDGQPLNVTMVFELTSTDQASAEFGFKVLYSAGFKASHASDSKNSITLKLVMHGTQAIIEDEKPATPQQ